MLMIASFAVSNYRSIGPEQRVSFLSTTEKENRELYAVEVRPGVFVNRLAVFFGSNASGKSNLLNALESVFQIMVLPTTDKNSVISQYIPFALSKGDPALMEVEFYKNRVRYNYHVEFNRNTILSERLAYYPEGRPALFYERRFVDLSSQPYIKFGKGLGISTNTIRTIREATFNNNSVLSTVGRLSLPHDASLLIELHEWAAKHISCLNADTGVRYYASELSKINADRKKKEFYIRLLAKADFNIVNFRLVDNKENLSKEIIMKLMDDKGITEEERTAILSRVVFTNHSANGDFEVPLELQSEGTLRFIELLDALYDMVTGNHIYLLDELGNRMHYELLLYYVTLFLYNSEESQMFFTTQSILLLDEDIMRRDVIYLTEKDPDSATTCYTRVSDLGLHRNLSIYNAYRMGKLGARPDLGSPYLNLSKS